MSGCLLESQSSAAPILQEQVNAYMRAHMGGYPTQEFFSTIPPHIAKDYTALLTEAAHQHNQNASDLSTMMARVQGAEREIGAMNADNTSVFQGIQHNLDHVSGYQRFVDIHKGYRCACGPQNTCADDPATVCKQDSDCVPGWAGITCNPATCTNAKILVFRNPAVTPGTPPSVNLQVNGFVQPSEAIVHQFNNECLVQAEDTNGTPLKVSGPCDSATVTHEGSIVQDRFNLFQCDITYDHRCGEDGFCATPLQQKKACKIDSQCKFPVTVFSPKEGCSGAADPLPEAFADPSGTT